MNADGLPNSPGVYQITCSANGAQYVGSSIDVHRRVVQHISCLSSGKHSNKRLQRTWDKYGRDQFAVFLLEEVSSEADLISREQYWLDSAKERRGALLMNLSPSAQNTLGYKFARETVDKIAAKLRGYKHDEAFRQKCRERMLRFRHTEESRKKISQANMGHAVRPISEETRRKISVASRGRKMPESAREKIAASKRGIPRSPEMRAKLSATKLAKNKVMREAGYVWDWPNRRWVLPKEL